VLAPQGDHSTHQTLVEEKSHKLLSSIQSNKCYNRNTMSFHYPQILYLWIGLLTKFCKLQTNTCTSVMIIHRHLQSSENSKLSTHTFVAEVKRGNTLSFCFSAQTLNKCLFHGQLSAMLFISLSLSFSLSLSVCVCVCARTHEYVFWSFISLFKNSSKNIVQKCSS
jgi:hypothetical protein